MQNKRSDIHDRITFTLRPVEMDKPLEQIHERLKSNIDYIHNDLVLHYNNIIRVRDSLDGELIGEVTYHEMVTGETINDHRINAMINRINSEMDLYNDILLQEVSDAKNLMYRVESTIGLVENAKSTEVKLDHYTQVLKNYYDGKIDDIAVENEFHNIVEVREGINFIKNGVSERLISDIRFTNQNSADRGARRIERYQRLMTFLIDNIKSDYSEFLEFLSERQHTERSNPIQAQIIEFKSNIEYFKQLKNSLIDIKNTELTELVDLQEKVILLCEEVGVGRRKRAANSACEITDEMKSEAKGRVVSIESIENISRDLDKYILERLTIRLKAIKTAKRFIYGLDEMSDNRKIIEENIRYAESLLNSQNAYLESIYGIINLHRQENRHDGEVVDEAREQLLNRQEFRALDGKNANISLMDNIIALKDSIRIFEKLKEIKERLNPELLKDDSDEKVNDIIKNELEKVEKIKETFTDIIEGNVEHIVKRSIKNKFDQEIQRIDKKVSDIQYFASVLREIDRFKSQKNKLHEEINNINTEAIISTRNSHDSSEDFTTDSIEELIKSFAKIELDSDLLENAPNFIKEKVQAFRNDIEHLKEIKAENDVTSYSVNDLTKSVQDYNIGGKENDLTRLVLNYKVLSTVKHLTENKANINARGNKGQTFLHSAAIIGNESMVSSLLKKGAIFNIKDQDGKTPKDLSQNQNIIKLLEDVGLAFDHVRKKNVEALSHLIAQPEYRDILINVRDEFYRTLFHSAVAQKQTNKEDQVKIVNLLINNGIDIHAQDLRGHSSLYIAIKNKEEKVIDVLLKKGAEVDNPTIEFAKQNSDETIVKKLEQHHLNKFMSVGSCSSGSSRAKREVSDCISWEDIDEFNEEKGEPRNPEKIQINSEKFISYIQNSPEEKRSALIEFANRVGEEKVVGKFQGLVNKLTSNQRVMNHFNRVGRISSIGMHGMMGKAALGALLRGDYKDVAINLGFIGGSQLFGRLAEAASIRGTKFIAEGKLFLGRSSKIASPFLARGTSAFVAYDLYKQIQAYKNGNKDALVGIVGDSIILGVDSVEIGIEVAEVFGVIEGVSSVTGPVGGAIGIVIFVGTDIYSAVKRVDKIDQVIHLTGWEKFKEGSRAFIGMNPEEYVEELMKEKQANNQLVKQALEFLKNNTNIQKYVFPTGKTVATCHSVRHTLPCGPFVTNDGPSCYRDQRGNVVLHEDREECTTKLKMDLDNEVRLDRKSTRIKWKRSKPDNPGEGELFCLPGVRRDYRQERIDDIRKTSDSLLDLSVVGLVSVFYSVAISPQTSGIIDTIGKDYEHIPSDGAYLCENAIGSTMGDRTGNITLIDLGKGNDVAVGFKDTPNLFRVNDGHKNYTGGNQGDQFILQGSGITGYLSGGKGIDTIDLGGFALGKTATVNLNGHYITYKGVDNYVLRIENFESVLGRKEEVDNIYAACKTERIDGRGGKSDNERDLIVIGNNKENCSYKTQIVVGPNTDVESYASNGTFTYIVNSGQGQAKINLFEAAQHNFIFNYLLSDVESINKTQNRVTFSLSNSNVESRFNITILEPGTTRNISYSFNDNSRVILGEKNIFVLQSTNNPVSEVINNALPIVNRLGAYFSAQSGNESIVIAHKNNDVIESNPNSKTHLIGSDGENVYVINPGNETIHIQKLPLPEVVIYNLDRENQGINTISFHDLLEKLDDELYDGVKLNVGQSGNDILLALLHYRQINHEIITVRLKDGVFWHEKAHVIIDNIPMRIKQDRRSDMPSLQSWSLNPIPLNFSKEHKFIYIAAHDIMNSQEINIGREVGDYTLSKDKNNLVINDGSEYSVILEDFFTNYVMQTLQVNFSDKKINLRGIDKSNITELNDIKNVHKKRIDEILGEFKDKIEAENATVISNSTASQILHSREKRSIKVPGNFDIISEALFRIFGIGKEIPLAPKKDDMAGDLNLPLGKDELSQSNKPSFKINEESVTSAGSRPSSWINTIIGAATKSISRLGNFVLSSTKASFFTTNVNYPTLPSQQGNAQNNNITTLTQHVDVDGTILLLDVCVRKLTGNKYKQPKHDSLLSPKELMERKMDNIAISAINKFGKVCDNNDFQNAINKVYDNPMTCVSNVSLEKPAINMDSQRGIL